MASPRISVIMPAFNRERYVAESMRSVLAQSFKGFELIVVDDGSTDRTLEIAREIAATDPRVRIESNSKNLGIARTRNKALGVAQAEYVALLDSDDIWVDRDKLAKQAAFLDAHPDHALVGGAIRHIDPDGKALRVAVFPESDASIRKIILRFNPFAQSTLMYRKDAILEAGGYSPAYQVCDDYALWLAVGKKYKFANFGDIFTGYRIHGSNITRTKRLTAAREIFEIVRANSAAYPRPWIGIAKAYVRLVVAFFRT
ncbi:MAG: glycosyltransferase family 2 protein [Patescibacteria group bacterium]|nr:glycosyltransferase family 2 protein [Patescibacteria group bacterium]